MSCRHDLANGTCVRCYPTNPHERSPEDRIDPGPEGDYGPNLDGPGAVAAEVATERGRVDSRSAARRAFFFVPRSDVRQAWPSVAPIMVEAGPPAGPALISIALPAGDVVSAIRSHWMGLTMPGEAAPALVLPAARALAALVEAGASIEQVAAEGAGQLRLRLARVGLARPDDAILAKPGSAT